MSLQLQRCRPRVLSPVCVSRGNCRRQDAQRAVLTSYSPGPGPVPAYVSVELLHAESCGGQTQSQSQVPRGRWMVMGGRGTIAVHVPTWSSPGDPGSATSPAHQGALAWLPPPIPRTQRPRPRRALPHSYTAAARAGRPDTLPARRPARRARRAEASLGCCSCREEREPSEREAC